MRVRMLPAVVVPLAVVVALAVVVPLAVVVRVPGIAAA
jgi:hypothetical protein